MEPSDFDAIFIALQAAHVRYIVVGGVAVVLHGSPRFTADLDLVIALEDENVRAALAALEGLGYRPRAPVPAQQFADPETRRSWIEDKGLTVFSLWSPDHPATEIDIFVEEPFPFDDAYARAVQADLGTSVVTCRIRCRFDRPQATRRSPERSCRHQRARSVDRGGRRWRMTTMAGPRTNVRNSEPGVILLLLSASLGCGKPRCSPAARSAVRA